MALDNRDLKAGQKLVARYKGQEHSVLVLGDETTNGLGFELDEGTIYKSLSSAGSAVMGGTSCNGWRFWSPEGSLTPKKGKAAATAKKSVKPESKIKQLRRVPNQKGVPEGQTKWFCSACMKGFVADGTTEPDACPEGHSRETTDEFVTAD